MIQKYIKSSLQHRMNTFFLMENSNFVPLYNNKQIYDGFTARPDDVI